MDQRKGRSIMQTEVDDLDMNEDEDDIVENEDDFVDMDDEDDDSPDDTVEFSTAKGSDNIGDVSVEINVEDLIAEFERTGSADAARRKEIRRRLEEIREQREAMRDLEDTFSFDPNDDD